MRRYLTLGVDLGWVGLTAILAVVIRDNLVPYESHVEQAGAYAVIAVVMCALVFGMSATHKTLWQYTSLPDVLRVVAAVTVGLLLAVFVSFVFSRLEGVARSVPIIHWFLLVSAMIGTRVAFRVWEERARRHDLGRGDASVQHVLIVGLSHLTELYLQSVAEYASRTLDIVGILTEQRELRGRLLRFHKVLGTPEALPQVMAELEVHGVAIERIVVMEPFAQLSRPAAEALLEVERTSEIRVDWMAELLGLTERERSSPQVQASLVAAEMAQTPLGTYGYVKRAIDVAGAVGLSLVLAPLIFVTGLLVALDVGFPLVFWQKRPGCAGHSFKLYKFCTMRSAHDAQGNRIDDEDRSSVIGRLLRRTRLDELPQLYNILVGEMSFVGPRPLLPADQPVETAGRLRVKPGLTGLAQVRGERDMPLDDKNALDIWYVQNASLWLDLKILLLTPIVMIRGERIDEGTLRVARATLKRLRTPAQVTSSLKSYPLTAEGVVGGGEVEIVHPGI